MLARIRKAQDNHEGFTLIELLVVMIIIGILAAIAIPAFLSQKKKGYEASEKSDLRSIATEITTALVDSPATVTVVDGGGAATITAGTAVSSINLSPGNVIIVGKVTTAVVAGGPAVGAYCVAISNPKTGQDWKVSASGTGGQQIQKTGAAVAVAGDCP